MKKALIVMTTLCVITPVLAETTQVTPNKAAICSSCHGKDGNSPNPAFYPSIASIDKAEFIQKMRDYQQGKGKGPMAATMTSIAKSLTEDDIKELAIFFNAQPRR